MSVKQVFAALLSCLFLFVLQSVTAFAEVQLPPGAVKGLPERLAALDNEGRAVNSATGEYFFHVENMQYGQTYTKIVQLMNLREDVNYHIYFYVEPLYKNGEIDLEEGCECTFWLDENQIYKGTVTGKGNIDLTKQVLDCGLYFPGDSHQLKCSVIWNNLDVIKNSNNGHRLVDVNGEHVLVGPDDEGYAEGEIEFKWIFYASVFENDSDKTETPIPTEVESLSTEEVPEETISNMTENESQTDTDVSDSDIEESGTVVTTVVTEITVPNGQDGGFFTPFTGLRTKNGIIWLAAMGIIAVMIGILLILIRKKKRKNKK